MTEHATIARDAEQPPGDRPSITAIFGIGASADPTDVENQKDIMLGAAVSKENLRKTRSGCRS